MASLTLCHVAIDDLPAYLTLVPFIVSLADKLSYTCLFNILSFSLSQRLCL